ncbi:MAG: hydroxymethylglutaryl-CoA lyase [Chitinophagaceae bacterium]|nr:hydroxymethylglutaryl-CoA lyase [Chitinophagaceae bacterium]
MPQQIIIEEQGLRDGLQTITQTVPTAMKLQFIRQLMESGLKRIQVASFVHPKLIPQMADAEELINQLPSATDIIFSALVLNVKGVERAASTSLKHLSISLSASDTHSRKNANKSLEEVKAEFKEMMKLALQKGFTVRGGIQCAFGCRYEGAIDELLVYDLVQHHLDCGVQEIALADSTGMANPVQMKRMMHNVVELCKNVPVALHLHNTENKGYANVVAAIETGVMQFDTAFGGLGGCPFIKGATGNIATEDTVHMLYQMGYETGVDIAKVAAVSKQIEQFIQQPLPGLMYGLIGREDIKMI